MQLAFKGFGIASAEDNETGIFSASRMRGFTFTINQMQTNAILYRFLHNVKNGLLIVKLFWP